MEKEKLQMTLSRDKTTAL